MYPRLYSTSGRSRDAQQSIATDSASTSRRERAVFSVHPPIVGSVAQQDVGEFVKQGLLLGRLASRPPNAPTPNNRKLPLKIWYRLMDLSDETERMLEEGRARAE